MGIKISKFKLPAIINKNAVTYGKINKNAVIRLPLTTPHTTGIVLIPNSFSISKSSKSFVIFVTNATKKIIENITRGSSCEVPNRNQPEISGKRP